MKNDKTVLKNKMKNNKDKTVLNQFPGIRRWNGSEKQVHRYKWSICSLQNNDMTKSAIPHVALVAVLNNFMSTDRE